MSPATVLSLNTGARVALPATLAAPDFALQLTSLLVPGAPVAPHGVPVLPVKGDGEEAAAEGQAFAATGKDLPETLLEGEETPKDSETKSEDVAFAWFATAPLPDNAPIAIRLPGPVAAPRVSETGEPVCEVSLPGAAPVATAPVEAGAEAPVLPVAQPAAKPAASAPQPVAVKAESGESPAPAPAARLEVPVAAAAPAATPARIELALASAAQPAVQTAAQVLRPAPLAAEPVQAQPAAAPLIALQAELPGQVRRNPLREVAAEALTTVAQSAETARPTAVAPTPDMQQPVLDMRRHEWIGAMVDRIEEMRDMAKAMSGPRETQLRLSPDSLGTLDVSIRQEGDRVHVRFNAESSAARQLLAEAQPRLAELAEARGLKLGQTTVDGGAAGQQGQPRQDAPRAKDPSAPASAFAAAAEQETNTDTRIA